MDNSTTFHLKARAMLCTSLTVLLAACGGGSGTDTAGSGASTGQADTQTELLARRYSQWTEDNPTWKGDFNTWNANNKTTTEPTTTASTATASIATTPTTTTPTTTTPTTTTPTSTNNFYVATTGSDSNPGTQADPFRTILKASEVAVPDSTVHVAPGTYTGGFQTAKSGTASARIQYISDTKWGAKIAGGSNETLWDNRGNYVDIVGFEFDGSGATAVQIGIYLGGSYGVSKNNHVHHIATTIPCSSHGAGGIETDNYYGGVHNDVLNNVVHHVGSNNCGYYQGIYLSTSGTANNNLVYAISNTGITSWHNATNLIITNNTVFGNGQGITVGSGGYYNGFSGSNDNSVVANNIVYDNTGAGIDEEGSTGTRNLYINNLSYGNGFNWNLRNGLTHTGTVTADPQFMNYNRTGGGDYRLKSTSPAIDKGSPTYTPPTDLAQTVRVGSDLGAYDH